MQMIMSGWRKMEEDGGSMEWDVGYAKCSV